MGAWHIFLAIWASSGGGTVTPVTSPISIDLLAGNTVTDLWAGNTSIDLWSGNSETFTTD